MTPLDRALKRLAEVQREAAEIRRFIELYQKFDGSEARAPAPMAGPESSDTQLIGNSPDTLGNHPVDKPIEARRKTRHDGPTPREIAEIMERVIREAGRPMSRGDIVDALARRDIEIPAQDKARYVGTLAWRNKGTFVNIDGLGYWLRDTPFKPDAPGTHMIYAQNPPEEHSDELME